MQTGKIDPYPICVHPARDLDTAASKSCSLTLDKMADRSLILKHRRIIAQASRLVSGLGFAHIDIRHEIMIEYSTRSSLLDTYAAPSALI